MSIIILCLLHLCHLNSPISVCVCVCVCVCMCACVCVCSHVFRTVLNGRYNYALSFPDCCSRAQFYSHLPRSQDKRNEQHKIYPSIYLHTELKKKLYIYFLMLIEQPNFWAIQLLQTHSISIAPEILRLPARKEGL